MGDYPKQVDPNRPNRIRKVLSVVKPTRLEQRRQLADTWLLEEEDSRYRYDVETCGDGRLIYLLRPTRLNKGFDFQINLEGFPSRSNEAPKHNDILEDLKQKKAESPVAFPKLRELIDDVFACGEPDHLIAGS